MLYKYYNGCLTRDPEKNNFIFKEIWANYRCW